MDGAERKLRELAAEIEACRQAIDRDIEERRRQLTALDGLLQAMEASRASFDAEDLQAVRVEKDEHLRVMSTLQLAESEQAQLWQSTERILRDMAGCLEARTRVLEASDSTTGVLREHPQLCRSFARKQLALQKVIEDRLEEMLARARHQRHEQRPLTQSTSMQTSQGTRTIQ
jgi:hypothetical protein